jgi:hypothetical protein
VTDPATGTVLVVTAANVLHADRQVLDITWIYDASPASGGPVERTIAQVAYHYYFPHQIELLLQESGLRLQALLGGYDQAPFDEGAERLLVLAQKPA